MRVVADKGNYNPLDSAATLKPVAINGTAPSLNDIVRKQYPAELLHAILEHPLDNHHPSTDTIS
ncbi:MAG: hypothetical protein H6765_01830 [Candidatus Peribacteria bacterium]|nr:MAG: hypothetical protein H6765_01830 [Candidatus Peribacteria bacterium]